ncbi:MAG: glycosyltransferase family 2 protein, partial [Candidatus Omnitrophota bacterium]
ATHTPFRLIIVDNASDRETAQYLESARERNPKAVNIIRNNENLGWVKAVNQGLFYSQSSYVCVMNNDTVVYPGWLNQMTSVAEKEETIGLVNPLWELPRRYKARCGDYFNKVVSRQGGEYIETDWARGFCFLIKRKVINKIGGLDEAFSPGYYDDWDYSARAQEAGFRCVRAKGAFVWHYIGKTYSGVLGRRVADELFQDKGKVFYRRWGRPLKGLLIIDTHLNKDPAQLRKIILLLLREQNKLFIISSQKLNDVEHTSCRAKYFINSMLGLRAAINIMDNFRHSASKRYNFIICSPEIGKFFKWLPFIRNNYLIKEFKDLVNEKDLLNDLTKLKKYE